MSYNRDDCVWQNGRLVPVLCQLLNANQRLLSLLEALIRSREVSSSAPPDATPIQETGEGLQKADADSDGDWIVPVQPSDDEGPAV